MPEEITLTPLEISRQTYGQRFYSIKNGYYVGWFTSLNARRGNPKGVGTKAVTMREVPERDDVQLSADGQWRLLAYPERLYQESDESFNTDHPNINELTKAEWDALMPETVP